MSYFSGNVSYMWDSSLRITFTSSEPSFAFVFDAKMGLHSIYKIRQASNEECQHVNVTTTDNTSFMCNSVYSNSLHHTGSTALGMKNSTNKTYLSTLGKDL